MSFRASEARPGIQESLKILDTGLRRYDGAARWCGCDEKGLDSGLRECVAIVFCHYETPLRRRGNPMYSATYEIASVAMLPRNDIVTQSLCGNDKIVK